MANGASTAIMRINGNDALKVEAQSTTNQWVTLDFTGTITQIELGYLGGSGSSNTYYALAVDGQILLDGVTESHAYGQNGFHLDFANGATDSSPNSNDFTAVGMLFSGDGTYYSNFGSGSAQSNRPFVDAFDGSTTTFCEPTDNNTVTFDFTSLSGGGIAVSSSLRMFLNKAGTPSASHFTVNGTNLGGSVPSDDWLTISGVSLLETITFYHASGSSSVELKAVEVDGLILVDGDKLDRMVDSPTNGTASTGGDPGGSVVGNYAVLNPLNSYSNTTLSKGNLYINSGNNWGSCHSTLAFASGKYYYEFTADADQYVYMGVALTDHKTTQYPSQGISWAYLNDGNCYYNQLGVGAQTVNTQQSIADGDCIGCAIDMDNGFIWWSRNGAWMNNGNGTGNPETGANPVFTNLPAGTKQIVAAVDVYGNSGTVNFGQKKFKYAAPAGFKSLCSTNLPTPAISKGSSYVDAKPYIGTGASNPQALGFTPDLVLLKRRTGANAKGMFFDQFRGASNSMYVTDADGQNTNQQLSSFTADNGSLTTNGFSPAGSSGFINADGADYAAWAWDAGETSNSVSAGGLNSSTYNTDYTWSSSYSGAALSSGFPIANAFDGNRNTAARVDATQTAMSVALANITVTDSIEVCGENGFTTPYVSVTVGGVVHQIGSDPSTLITGSAGTTTRKISGISGSLTNVTVGRVSSGRTYLSQIIVDGKILVDNGTTPPDAPSIATSYRSTPSAGCSVVSYSGVDTPSVNTVAHGLNKAPELYIIKKYTSTSALGWIVNTTVIDGSVDYAVLNTNAAKADQGSPWYTPPGPTTFTLGANDSNTCDAGQSYVAYCFHSVEGFSKIGTFENHDGEGAFVYCGFRPRIILAKNMVDLGSQTGIGDWMIYDTARNPFSNPTNQNTIALNEPNQEDDFYGANQAQIDILSNGFKIRHYGSSPLGDPSRLFWFAAWAENPFALNSRAT